MIMDRGKCSTVLKTSALVALFCLTVVAIVDPVRALSLLWLDPVFPVSNVGGAVDVDIRLDDVSNVFAVQMSLAFDPTVLQVTGEQLTAGTCPQPDFVAENEADNGSGTMAYAVTQLNPTPPCSGGTVATISFECLAEGTSAVTFESSIIADPDAVEIIHDVQNATVSCGEFDKQNIPLDAGWNMISSYIVPADPAMDAVFPPLVRDNLVLCKDGQGRIYWPEMNLNEIGAWVVENGYQCYMRSEELLFLSGTKVIPQQMPIELAGGWSLIAYLRDSGMPVETALSSISEEIYLVKNGRGEVYWPLHNIDQIGNMQPGQGYQVYTSVPGTLTYPAN